MVNSIMIVEDDKKMARVVKAYLEGAGFRVSHFEKGKDAVEAALKEVPLLVILDLMLPDTSGEEVCQDLKEIGDFPVIMLTAKSSEDERIAGFALGADDYVVKPFRPEGTGVQGQGCSEEKTERRSWGRGVHGLQ